MPAAIAVAALVVASFAAYQQYEAAGDQADAAKKQGEALERQGTAQKDQFDLESKRADIQNARQARAAIRQGRIARASVINAGANTGTLMSSGVAGGAGSVQSQTAGNLSFFNETGGINQQIIGTQRRQGQAATDAGVAQAEMLVNQGESAQWGAIGQLGGTVFKMYSGGGE